MVNFDDFRTVFEVTPVGHRFQPCFSHRFARFAGLPERHDTCPEWKHVETHINQGNSAWKPAKHDSNCRSGLFRLEPRRS